MEEITKKKVKALEVESILDADTLDRIFAQYEGQIAAVIHFAGLKAVAESISIPLRYYHNNLSGRTSKRLTQRHLCPFGDNAQI